MKNSIQHPTYGTITYEEGLWTGKKTIAIGQVQLQKVHKNVYQGMVGGTLQQVIVRGSVLVGVILTINGEQVEAFPKPAWYDYVLSMLPMALIMIWGNSYALGRLLPVVGGAIGGALGGGSVVITLFLLRNKTLGSKLLTTLLAILATFGIGTALGFLIALAFVAAR